MATSEAHFVRASPERSSRSRVSGHPTGQATPGLNVDTIRQRAQQAAEYYHKSVRPTGSREGKEEYHAPRANGGLSLEPPREGGQGDTYKHKLRAGYINLRNSYNEKRPRNGQYSRGAAGGQDKSRANLGRVHENLQASHSTPGANSARSTHYRSLVERRGLYRSNSSLELFDNDEEVVPPTNLRRDYGSASSLDVISNSGESFFAMLQDYRNENVDQRAPPPPQVQDVLRGHKDPHVASLATSKGDLRTKTPSGKVSNGSVPVEEEAPSAGDSSPKLHKKSLKGKDKKPRVKSVVSDSSGLFRKLRGKTDSELSSKSSVDTPGEIDPRSEERQKRKAFVHYDVQSIGVTMNDVLRRRLGAGGDLNRRNTTTGASAANNDDSDIGDGKNNDLVQSCPFFRNELGGEEERAVCLNRSTAQKRVQQLLGNKHVDTQTMTRSPTCNGVAILDTSHSPHGVSQQPIQYYKGMVLEYVDHGAFYYRNFFNGFGKY